MRQLSCRDNESRLRFQTSTSVDRITLSTTHAPTTPQLLPSDCDRMARYCAGIWNNHVVADSKGSATHHEINTHRPRISRQPVSCKMRNRLAKTRNLNTNG
ncbi:hypothetical protein RSAG8_12067, partial [Rhizoctonia solani AG-8 WAC10335]